MTDEEKMTAIERLEEVLHQKDRELNELRGELEAAERSLRGVALGWSAQVGLPKEQTLPVPRLELFYSPDKHAGWTDYTVTYRMVYRFFLGDVVAVPISQTRISGGHDTARRPIEFTGKISLPFRDGCHIEHDAKHLNLPAFAVLEELVEPIAPMAGPAPYEKANR